jgi:curved DNA-binding protein CbpA
MDHYNHYNVLKVSNTASQADIRKSFRYLALKYHPDKNKNSEESKQKFMQIVEAYKVLSDEQARKSYDIATATTSDNNKDTNNYQHVSYSSYDYNPTRRWTLSSNSYGIYSYADIKRRYIQNPLYGSGNSSMWDVVEKANIGI